MIGVFSKRGCWWISAAVSKPSMPGMFTSSRIAAKSMSMSRCKRLGAAPRVHEVLPEHGQDRVVAQQPRRLIVHEQDVDFVFSAYVSAYCY